MSNVCFLDIKIEHLRCPSCRHYYHVTDWPGLAHLTPAAGTGVLSCADIELGDLLLDACIKCPSCSTEAPAVTWVLCACYPLDFFDTDNLCHCGGEIWYTISKDYPAGALVCDRCGQLIKQETYTFRGVSFLLHQQPAVLRQA